MDVLEEDLGTYAAGPDGTVTLRFERVYARPIGTVWSAITEPERLADWLGAAELEPHVGGRFAVRVGPGGRVPITGRVLVWQPPAVLACSWAWPEGEAGTIRYELTEAGPHETRLVFTHTALPAGREASVLPGWHLYLERLGQAVGGSRPEPDFTDRHAAVRRLYARGYGFDAGECAG